MNEQIDIFGNAVKPTLKPINKEKRKGFTEEEALTLKFNERRKRC